eukprot:scaffold46614_cov214-Amphora_coffeaeformis.AAC.1
MDSQTRGEILVQVAKPVVKRPDTAMRIHLPTSKKSDRFAQKYNSIRDLVSGGHAQLDAIKNGDAKESDIDEHVDEKKTSGAAEALTSSSTHGLQCSTTLREINGKLNKKSMKAKTRSSFKRKEGEGWSFLRRLASKTESKKEDRPERRRSRGRSQSRSSSISPSLERVGRLWPSLRHAKSMDNMDDEIEGNKSVDGSWNFERIIDEEVGPELDLTHGKNVYKIKHNRSGKKKSGCRGELLLELTEDNSILDLPPREKRHQRYHSEGAPPVNAVDLSECRETTSSAAPFIFPDEISEDPGTRFERRAKSSDPCAQDSFLDSADFILDALMNGLASQSSYWISSFWSQHPDEQPTQRWIEQIGSSDTLSELGMLSASEGHYRATAREVGVCGSGMDVVSIPSNDVLACMTPTRNEQIKSSDSIAEVGELCSREETQ